jgi:hypothetical protein
MSTDSEVAQRSDVWEALKKTLGLSDSPAKTPNARATHVTWNSQDLLAPCGDGQRTSHLVGLAGSYLAMGFTLDQTIEHCLMWNQRNTPPLDDAKVISTCTSIATSDARNHPERSRGDVFALLQPITPLFDLNQARIDHFLLTPPPPQRWVLDGVLPLGVVAAMVSPGGMGKSQLLMQLSYSVATRILLAGHWQVGESGSVLMLCAEDGVDEIHRRVDRIHKQLGGGLSSAAMKQLTDRLFVRSMIGEDLLMTMVGKNNEAIRTILVERLALTAKQAADIKLLVIDPASRFRGGDENSNQHATRFVQALEYLAQTTGATVLIAHHASKASAYGDEATAQSSRGASALSDGIRLQFALTPVAARSKFGANMSDDERRRHVEVSVVKTNYTAPQAPVLLRREDDGYLQAVAGATSSNSPGTLLMLELLRLVSAPPGKLTARHIEMNMCGPNKALDVSQKDVRGLIQKARDAGWIAGMKGKALRVTVDGQAHLAANPPAASAAKLRHGAARQRRAPQKKPIKSTT